jgi:hypothetical protein
MISFTSHMLFSLFPVCACLQLSVADLRLQLLSSLLFLDELFSPNRNNNWWSWISHRGVLECIVWHLCNHVCNIEEQCNKYMASCQTAQTIWLVDGLWEEERLSEACSFVSVCANSLASCTKNTCLIRQSHVKTWGRTRLFTALHDVLCKWDHHYLFKHIRHIHDGIRIYVCRIS